MINKHFDMADVVVNKIAEVNKSSPSFNNGKLNHW